MKRKPKKKRSALYRLQQKERERRLVPEVVIRRRRAMATVPDDPAFAVLAKAERYSNRHAKTIYSLMVRSKGLTEAPDAVERMFTKDGLDDVHVDSRTKAIIENSTMKINEVLIFMMVARELINNKAVRERVTDLFIEQRFDMMKPRVMAPPQSQVPAPSPQDSKTDLLMAALAAAIGVT